MKKILHIINGLGKGGAETMLVRVITKSEKSKFSHFVVSLGATHYYEETIKDKGIPIIEFEPGKEWIRQLVKIRRLMSESDTICCWTYNAIFFGYLLSFCYRDKLVWCIRHCLDNLDVEKRRTRLIIKKCAIWSKNVKCITYNGMRSKEIHEKMGFSSNNGVIVENGCDINEYQYIPVDKGIFCKELHISEESFIITSIARNHPIKDIPLFIEAYSKVLKKNNKAIGVLCGRELDRDNEKLVSLCRKYGLTPGGNIFLLGLRSDITRILSASDLYVLHSVSEAFPNGLIEAMACECVCISTDVGDVRDILNNDHYVLDERNPSELADMIVELLNMPKSRYRDIGRENRQRIVENYSIEYIVKMYEKLW